MVAIPVTIQHPWKSIGACAGDLTSPVRGGGNLAVGGASREAANWFPVFPFESVPLKRLIQWQADWIQNGGRDIGKPTHFEVNNGIF